MCGNHIAFEKVLGILRRYRETIVAERIIHDRSGVLYVLFTK